MKRTFSLIILVAIMLNLSACGGRNSEQLLETSVLETITEVSEMTASDITEEITEITTPEAEPQPSADDLLIQVYEHFEKGEDEQTIPLLEKAIELGSRHARYQLGILYLADEFPGLEQDISKGHTLIAESVSQDGLIDDLIPDVDFIYDIAFNCYQTDDWKNAKPLLVFASEMGHVQAQTLLASRTRDYADQTALYIRAAESGYAPAMYNLAVNYEYGYGVEADVDKAYEIFNQVASDLYTKQKNIEDPFIALTIGFCYSYGDAPFKKNYDKAAEFFELAAWLGDPEGAYRLARLIYDGHIEADTEDLIGWLTEAAKAGHETALYILGSMYLSGYLVETDESLGYALMQMAAERGSYDASNYLNNNMLILY